MRRRLLLGALIALACSSVCAQWKQEPSTVFGLPLGGQITPAMDCPPRGTGSVLDPAPPTTGCLRRNLPGQPPDGAEVDGLPYLGFYALGIARLTDDRIESISLAFDYKDFGKMADILTERYGKPHSEKVEQVGNALGGSFQRRVLHWAGKRVTIAALERAGKVDTSAVIFTSVDVLIARGKAQKESAKGPASKF